MSVAGEGLTEPNLYFRTAKMQTDPSGPQFITTHRVVSFVGMEFTDRIRIIDEKNCCLWV
jgi:hypothetical protein